MFICVYLWLITRFSKVFLNKIYHQIQFTLGQLIAKRYHSIAAVCYVIVYLFVRFVFVFAVANVWRYAAIIERFPFALRPMANSAILAEERCFVGFAVGDRIMVGFRIQACRNGKNSQ